MILLESADEVIDYFGGTNKFAKLVGASQANVSMWRVRGFPSSRFKAITDLLKAKEACAPARFGECGKSSMVELWVPLPPSANRLWRVARGRVIKSQEYISWLKEATIEAGFKRIDGIAGTFKISITACKTR